MEREKSPSKAAGQATEPVPGVPVSIRTIYADAMREVMADPRKAIAEHDPWLAALLFSYGPATHPKS